jgi:hypothetical protein
MVTDKNWSQKKKQQHLESAVTEGSQMELLLQSWSRKDIKQRPMDSK